MEQATTGLVPQSKFNEQKMTSLMSEREESRISVKDFCKLHQFTEATYYYWRRKLLNKNDPPQMNDPSTRLIHFGH